MKDSFIADVDTGNSHITGSKQKKVKDRARK